MSTGAPKFWTRRGASMPRPNDRSALRDIEIQCGDIAAAVAGHDEDSFFRDRMRAAAVERYLEIIGEATKRLTAEFRASHSDVDWRGWAGLRDVVIHAYDQVIPANLWQIATAEVPDLAERVTAILQDFDSSDEQQ